MALSSPVGRLAVPAALGFVLGSLPVADFVSARHGVDLRAVGDRNPGYWNARQSIGREPARAVLAGDVAKGAVAAMIGRAVGGPLGAVVGGGAAMAGHAWPLFAGFRGGRAVATFAGAATVLSPRSAAGAVGAGVVGWRVSSSGAAGVRTAFAAYPLAQLVVDGPRRTALTGVLMSFVGLRFWMAGRHPRGGRSDRANECGG